MLANIFLAESLRRELLERAVRPGLDLEHPFANRQCMRDAVGDIFHSSMAQRVKDPVRVVVTALVEGKFLDLAKPPGPHDANVMCVVGGNATSRARVGDRIAGATQRGDLDMPRSMLFLHVRCHEALPTKTTP